MLTHSPNGNVLILPRWTTKAVNMSIFPAAGYWVLHISRPDLCVLLTILVNTFLELLEFRLITIRYFSSRTTEKKNSVLTSIVRRPLSNDPP